jgi:small neutral amino acid transporter SnatA (MarC family)
MGVEIGANKTGGAAINQTILVSSTNVTFAPVDNQKAQPALAAEAKQSPAISPLLTTIIVAPFTISAVLASLGRLTSARSTMTAELVVIFIVLFVVNIQPKT